MDDQPDVMEVSVASAAMLPSTPSVRMSGAQRRHSQRSVCRQEPKVMEGASAPLVVMAVLG